MQKKEGVSVMQAWKRRLILMPRFTERELSEMDEGLAGYLRREMRLAEQVRREEGLPKQARSEACEHCGEEYRKRRRWQRFCSPACRMEDWRAGRDLGRDLGRDVVMDEAHG